MNIDHVTRKRLTALTLAIAIASPSVAQSPSSSASSSDTQSSTQSSQSQNAQSAKEASKDELKVSQEDVQQEVTDANKASKIIGMAVYNKENERLGKVHELVVDQKSGKVAYAVLSTGGAMGLGDKLVAVPFESLTPQQGSKGFLINADKNRLSQAPGISEKNWPKLEAAQESTVGLSPTGRPSSDPQKASSGSSSQPNQSSPSSDPSSASANPTPSSDPNKQP